MLVHVQWRLWAGKGFGTNAEEAAAEKAVESVRPTAAESDTTPLAFEPKKRQKVIYPKVNAPVVDKVTSNGPLSEDAQVETAFVAVLLFMFTLLFGMGVFVAASGFLPEEWDQFAVDTVYPAFTPVLGIFLLLSSAYGFYKAKRGEM